MNHEILDRTQQDQLGRLLSLRELLTHEREYSVSPAIASALRVADMYLFLALGYFGYADLLFPDQRSP